MGHEPHHDSHGNTPAAWTACIIIMVAFLVGGLGLIAKQPPVFWVGIALVVVGIIVGYVMSLMGYGQPRHEPHTLPLSVDEVDAEAAAPSEPAGTSKADA
jgi:hypothetical protein